QAGGYQDGTSPDAWFSGIAGLASDGTALYVADSGSNRRLRKGLDTAPLAQGQPAPVNSTLTVTVGAVTTVAGNGNNITTDGTGADASFKDMYGTAVVGGFAYTLTPGAIRKTNLATGAVST